MESSLKIGSVRSLYILFAIIIIAAFCLVMSVSKADGEAVVKRASGKQFLEIGW